MSYIVPWDVLAQVRDLVETFVTCLAACTAPFEGARTVLVTSWAGLRTGLQVHNGNLIFIRGSLRLKSPRETCQCFFALEARWPRFENHLAPARNVPSTCASKGSHELESGQGGAGFLGGVVQSSGT